jgi:type II secretory pathway pseudopilin PulG
VTAVALIDLPSLQWNPRDGWSRLVARLRDDRGVGLVELLIALMVLNIGIFATLAAFTSGAVAIRRASHVSTASAIADKQLEAYRDTSFTNGIVAIPSPGVLVTGADGRSYTLIASVNSGSQKTGVTYPGSGQVKLVTIKVYDGAPNSGGALLVTSSSTYSLCTQSGLGTETTPCQS